MHQAYPARVGQELQTQLCGELGIEYPIFCAGFGTGRASRASQVVRGVCRIWFLDAFHSCMPGEIPRSLKWAKALLIMTAIFLALNTVGRLGVVGQFGVAPGLSDFVGIAMLLIVGATYLLACVGAFFLLGAPSRLHWWLVVFMPLLAIANIAVAVVVLPAQQIGAGTVLDVYLFNGILPLVVSGLLLKRQVRVLFGISRPARPAKAA